MRGGVRVKPHVDLQSKMVSMELGGISMPGTQHRLHKMSGVKL